MGCRPSDTHTVGLHDDGTVESTSSGDTHSASLANTRVWENIIVIEAGYNCTYGINRNREVVSTQESSIVKRWSGIVDLAAGNYDHGIIGLSIHGNLTPENSFLNVITINGAPNIEQKSINDWEGIIKIVANKYCVLGLTNKNTVEVKFNYYAGHSFISDEIYTEVTRWRDIVEVAAGLDFVIGLKDGGAIVYAGRLHGDISMIG